MGRHIYRIDEMHIETKGKSRTWYSPGDMICGTRSAFAERIIPWDRTDQDGCGSALPLERDEVLAAAWELRHDEDSKDDIRAMVKYIKERRDLDFHPDYFDVNVW